MFDISLLGENIRNFRRLCGLTQSALAEKLYLTAQNVSKWETGKSAPDIENLCLLANALGVSIDALLGRAEQDSERLLISIDGGGTKTEFCLFKECGEVIASRVLEGSNPNTYGIERACDTLRRGVDELLSLAPGVCAVYAGIAGCGLEANKRSIYAFLRRRYHGIEITVDGDIPSIIYSTKMHNDCIAVIMGTGSVVCASKDGKLERIGGYGYLFDDGYSGYTLGRDAVKAALCDEDGIGERTLITDMLREEFSGSTHEMLNTLYSSDKDRIAGFSGIVFSAYDKNDTVARKIISDAIGVTLSQIRAAQSKHKTSGHLVLAGGLTARRDILEENIGKCEFDLFYPTLPPIYGAAVCAVSMLGDVTDGFSDRFKDSYLVAAKRSKEGKT